MVSFGPKIFTLPPKKRLTGSETRFRAGDAGIRHRASEAPLACLHPGRFVKNWASHRVPRLCLPFGAVSGCGKGRRKAGPSERNAFPPEAIIRWFAFPILIQKTATCGRWVDPAKDQLILNMQLNRIMTEYVEVIAPKMPIQEAAKQMRSLDVGVLPVCNGDRLVGMLTDRDVTIRAVADGRDPKTTTVEEVMTRHVHCCFEDQDTKEAERVMEKNQIRRLPVLDRDKRIVGIVSLGDLAIKDDENRAGVTLERVSEHPRWC